MCKFACDSLVRAPTTASQQILHRWHSMEPNLTYLSLGCHCSIHSFLSIDKIFSFHWKSCTLDSYSTKSKHKHTCHCLGILWCVVQASRWRWIRCYWWFLVQLWKSSPSPCRKYQYVDVLYDVEEKNYRVFRRQIGSGSGSERFRFQFWEGRRRNISGWNLSMFLLKFYHINHILP